MNRLITTVIAALLLTFLGYFSSNVQAKLEISLNHKPAKQIKTNTELTKAANINLGVTGQLDFHSGHPGLTLMLGYEVFCLDKTPVIKTVAQKSVSSGIFYDVQLKYNKVEPDLSGDWNKHYKLCLLSWNGGYHRAVTNEGEYINSTLTGEGHDIQFTYINPKTPVPAESARGSQKTFKMLKP